MPAPTTNGKHKYRHVVRAVYRTPWALLPEKLDVIVDILDMRAGGYAFTEEEIAARIGDQRSAQEEMQVVGNVAIIPIYGVIAQKLGIMERMSGGTSTEHIAHLLDVAMADEDVKSIVLDIDSPGGSVFGVQELGVKIAAAAESKKIVAVANPMAASAAYWLGSQATEFAVMPSGKVGSIGVLGVHVDRSEQNKKLGIGRTYITAGKYKAEGNPDEPLSEEALAHLQEAVDDYYDDFVAAVASGRGVSESTVRSGFGQGRMLGAKRALAEGMVDRIAEISEVVNDLRSVSTGSGGRSRAAFSLEGIQMNFEIFGRLVRIGMCAVTATEEQANAALARFFAAKGTAKPATDEEIVAALQQHIDTPPAVPAATAAPAAPAAPATPPAAPAAGATEDRSAQILAACRMSRLSSDAALSLAAELTADPTVTVATAMTRIQDRIAQEQTTTGPTHIRVEHTGRLQLQADAFDVLVARSGSAAGSRIWDRRAQEYREDWRPSASSRSIQGFSLLRLAEYCLCAEGYSASDLSRLNPLQLAQLAMGGRPEAIGFFASSDGPAYNTSGMFSNLLLDAANVSLRRSYDDARTTFQVWSRQGESLKDFKLTNKVIAGELSDPRAIPEDGEFEETTMADGKETYRLVVWGEIKSISWQAVVNDQLSAFTEIPKKMGNAMRRKQNRIVYDILKDNAALADSIALFHASAVGSGGHNNLTTGANPPAVATLNTMTQKMQEQRGLNTDGDGSAILNIMPRFLLGGPALRGTILELLGSTANPAKGGSAAGSSGVVNIWQNGLEPVIDGELGAVGGGSDVAYYLLADSNEIDTVEHAYLQGLEAPVIEQESAFDRLASRQRIYQAFAAKALDYRGMQKHAGA